MESNRLYFYLWSHTFWDPDQDRLLTRSCFGITGNCDKRILNYEGHVGHKVKFHRVWMGPDRLIRELESKIKKDFYNQLVRGTKGNPYEWINEQVTIEQLCNWVDWEVGEIPTVSCVV